MNVINRDTDPNTLERSPASYVRQGDIWYNTATGCIFLCTDAGKGIWAPINLSDSNVLWKDDPEYRSLMSMPSCVHNGWLYGFNQVAGQPVIATDGTLVREGPACPITTSYNNLLFMWSAGDALYGAVSSSRALVTARATSGTFTTGEVVSQEVSGATGRYVRTLDDGTISIMRVGSAAFAAEGSAGDRTITGASSGATIEPSAVSNGNRTFICRSADGWEDFVPEYDFHGQIYQDQFVYCPAVAGLDDKDLLLWFGNDSGSSNYTNTVYYNHPADGREWQELFTSDENTIRHFHGARLVQGVGGVAGADILLAYTGDTDSEAYQHCSLLLCDDIADFVTNPDDWKYNWGLDSSGAGFNRQAHISTGDGAPYCLVWGEHARPLTCVVDTDKRYGYYIPDHPHDEGRYVTKVDLVNKTYELIGPRTVGIGGHGVLAPDGTVLLTTLCEISGGAYLGNCDDYQRVYAIVNNGTAVQEIKRVEREDPWSMDTGLRWLRTVLVFPEDASYRVWCGGYRTVWSGAMGGTMCGRIDNRRASYHTGIDRAPQNLKNYVTNGLFDTNTTGWTDSATTSARDTDADDVDAADGQAASLQITPTASGWDYVYYDVPDYLKLRGSWVTLAMRVRNTHLDTVPIVSLRDSSNQGRSAAIRSDVTDWQDVSVEMFVPRATTRLRIMVYPRNAATGGGAIHISNVRVVPGARLNRVPSRVPS